jgi:hypothetical protein
MSDENVRSWHDTLNAEHLSADAEIRALLRTYSQAPRTCTIGAGELRTEHARTSGQTLTMTHHQARALLRASLPALTTKQPMRRPTAALLASLQRAHTAALKIDPTNRYTLPAAIAAALQLREDINAWLDRARWSQANAKAGTRWPHAERETPAEKIAEIGEQFSIMALTRQRTLDLPEPIENTRAA